MLHQYLKMISSLLTTISKVLNKSLDRQLLSNFYDFKFDNELVLDITAHELELELLLNRQQLCTPAINIFLNQDIFTTTNICYFRELDK